jgi:hypothetical protein
VSLIAFGEFNQCVSESVIMCLVSLIMRGEFNHACSECVTE